MSRILIALSTAAVVVAIPNSANARIATANHCYYQYLADLNGLVVVRGTIGNPTIPLALNPGSSFTFKVSRVVYGQKVTVGETIVFDDASVDWPDALVPFEDQTSAILMLRRTAPPGPRGPGTIAPPPSKNGYAIEGVFPHSDIKEDTARDRKEIVAVLKRYWHPLLEKESDPERLRELILLLAGIADKTDSKLLSSFVEHKDEWVARAAIAALVRADASDKHLEMAATDLKKILPIATEEHRTVRVIGSRRPEWLTSSLVFTHYHYLYYDSLEMNQRFLPLSRAIAVASKDEGYAIYYGALAVCKYGTPDDAALVRRFTAHKDERVRTQIQQTLDRWAIEARLR